ncbi:MAG: FkbM family methyltransferase [Okeania sp. SIO3B3]|nr:FkbM family methyltransferase [Okeania sp. SIO3B3]
MEQTENKDLIHFLDLGCSGSLDDKWSPLFSDLAFTGFDPNQEECTRMEALPTPYRTTRYLPFALAGEPGQHTLYMTNSIYCYSLLRPNHPWLGRFTFAGLFAETGQEAVAAETLDSLKASQGLDADIMKLDVQGLELPILRSGLSVLDNCFCVETETGFMENYVGETTFAQIDEFMRAQGFLMFDLHLNHMSRQNDCAGQGLQQPLWCQSVWLLDYVGQGMRPTPAKAQIALRICKALGFHDFGKELSIYFFEQGIMPSENYSCLATSAGVNTPVAPVSRSARFLSHLPDWLNRRLYTGLSELYGG